jgi:hypothetical protein
LDGAYEHGRKLIDNILQHVGHDDANGWKVIVSNNERDVQLINSVRHILLFRPTRIAARCRAVQRVAKIVWKRFRFNPIVELPSRGNLTTWPNPPKITTAPQWDTIQINTEGCDIPAASNVLDVMLRKYFLAALL